MCCRLRDAPEPDLAGHSVTMQPSQEDIVALHADVEAAWTASFADLVKARAPTILTSCLPLAGKSAQKG